MYNSEYYKSYLNIIHFELILITKIVSEWECGWQKFECVVVVSTLNGPQSKL